MIIAEMETAIRLAEKIVHKLPLRFLFFKPLNFCMNMEDASQMLKNIPKGMI